MSTISPSTDVFLSYSHQDESVAACVKKAFSEEGLAVFSASDVDSGSDIFRTIRTPLVASRAVIVILSPGLHLPPSAVAELGAAMAWDKPILVLWDGDGPPEVPQFLKKFRVFPMSKLTEAIKMVQRPTDALSPDEQAALVEVYESTGVPIDELLTQPEALDEIAHDFNERSSNVRSGERLAYDLLNLRKKGVLPTLRHRAKPVRRR